MKIRWMSQRDAESLKPEPNMALISICDPGVKRNFIGWEHTITLDFNDAYTVISDRSDIVLFTPELAKKIIEFCDALPKQVEWIMVHCHQGISRSSAVAKYLCEKYSEPFPKDYQYMNMLVYDTLKLGGNAAARPRKDRWAYAAELKGKTLKELQDELAMTDKLFNQINEKIKKEGNTENDRFDLEELNRKIQGIEMVMKHLVNKENPRYMDYYKLKTPLDPADIKTKSYIMKKGEEPILLPTGYDHLNYAILHGWSKFDEPDYDKWYLKQGYSKTTIYRNEFTVLGYDKKERDRLAMFLGVKPEDLKP
jgi:hypothetical protein